jgi:hypothetical protein
MECEICVVMKLLQENNNLQGIDFDNIAFPESVASEVQSVLGKPSLEWVCIRDPSWSEKLAREKEFEAAQRRSGTTPWTRIAGAPGSVEHVANGGMSLSSSFVTIGAPEALVNSGVLYYEVTIIKMEQNASPQFGFSLKDGVEDSPKSWGVEGEAGVGDSSKSWGVDGDRKCAWNDGQHPWPACVWSEGDVIGLAANTDVGKFAMSINGDWTGVGRGVAFESEMIKEGVFPCFSAKDSELRLSLAEFSHKLPDANLWATGGVEIRQTVPPFLPSFLSF